MGSSVVYDGFDNYLLGKDSTVTSNVTFGSNTVSLGTKSEVFISDPHTYKFKIMESGKTTYTSNVISSTPTRPTGRVYPPKSGTHKNLSTSSTANVDNTWTIDEALYGRGDYKASMNKTGNHVSQDAYYGFNGLIDSSCLHTRTSPTVAIQLHMPQKIKLTKYAMYSRNFTGEYTYAPRDWKVYGSNDNGTNWTELDSQTNQTVSAWGSQLDFRDTKREYTVTGNTKYFSSYKLDVTANGGNGSYVVTSQIEYYGDEEGFLSDDGFGKLTLDVKGDTSATSNIVFHSNTYVMGAARDLYITDTGEYTADIYGSNKHFLGSKTHTVSANATEFIWKENEDQILYASDIAAASDHFGTSVAIRGDYAISSSYSDDGEKGSAYIFYKSGGTWTQQAKLVASDAAGSDRFGWSVAIDGDYAIIGAQLDDDPTDSGSAYIFKRSGTSWTQQSKLTASDAAATDYFGYSVAISGDYAIVGTFLEDAGGTDAGAAYIFKRNVINWSSSSTFDNLIPVSGTYSSVSNWKYESSQSNTNNLQFELYSQSSTQLQSFTLNGVTYSSAANQESNGSMSVWNGPWVWNGTNQWIWTVNGPENYLIEVNASTGQYRLGHTHAVHGHGLVFGAYATPDSTTGIVNLPWGSFASQHGNPTFLYCKPPPDGTLISANNGIRFSKQSDGSTLLQVNVGDDTGTPSRISSTNSLPDVSSVSLTVTKDSEVFLWDSSSLVSKLIIPDYCVHPFDTDGGWPQQQKILSSDIGAGDRFGCSVSLSGDYAIVGAQGEDVGGSDAGAAYIFKKVDIFTSYTVRITRNGDTSSTGTGNFDITPSDGNVTLRNWGNSPSSGNLGAALWDNASGTSLRVYNDGTIILAGETLTTYTVGGSPATFYECGSGLGGTNFHVAITIVSRTTGPGWSQQAKNQCRAT